MLVELINSAPLAALHRWSHDAPSWHSPPPSSQIIHRLREGLRRIANVAGVPSLQTAVGARATSIVARRHGALLEGPSGSSVGREHAPASAEASPAGSASVTAASVVPPPGEGVESPPHPASRTKSKASHSLSRAVCIFLQLVDTRSVASGRFPRSRSNAMRRRRATIDEVNGSVEFSCLARKQSRTTRRSSTELKPKLARV
ncbi:hypothetical protein OUZ56_032553 [Daphnia magna]|uniref:Uncharacterized protein n=1 Tax=Daphnia magna TaxID=35525 RepID=A0ABR0B981_9CRUS|nr:hypothetical protein OUZ56_032553 [Daphnia magna]